MIGIKKKFTFALCTNIFCPGEIMNSFFSGVGWVKFSIYLFLKVCSSKKGKERKRKKKVDFQNSYKGRIYLISEQDV